LLLAATAIVCFIAWKKFTSPPPTFVKVVFPPSTPKTGHNTSFNFSNRAYGATVNGGFATVPVFCLFLFLFISAEFLKNHNKSQKKS